MSYQEHEPAHFHARRLIREWTLQHREELAANWEKMKAGVRLERIAPLE